MKELTYSPGSEFRKHSKEYPQSFSDNPELERRLPNPNTQQCSAWHLKQPEPQQQNLKNYGRPLAYIHVALHAKIV